MRITGLDPPLLSSAILSATISTKEAEPLLRRCGRLSAVADDYSVGFLETSGNDFARRPVRNSNGNIPALHLLVRTQNPNDRGPWSSLGGCSEMNLVIRIPFLTGCERNRSRVPTIDCRGFCFYPLCRRDFRLGCRRSRSIWRRVSKSGIRHLQHAV